MENFEINHTNMMEDPMSLPSVTMPAMAYVPYQQWEASNLYSPDQAHKAGTLFPVLDKPFYGRKGDGI